MKKLLVLLVSMFLVTSSAYAKMCPKLWAQFDVDVKTTKASAADVAKAKELKVKNFIKTEHMISLKKR
jgi:hypothetical protein